MTAPERIWLGGLRATVHGEYPSLFGRTEETVFARTEYVRADLYEHLQSRVDDLESAISWLPDSVRRNI